MQENTQENFRSSDRARIWIDKYGKNYISHATAKNFPKQGQTQEEILENIFLQKKIYPSEAAFRIGLALNIEHGMKDQRKKVCINHFAETDIEVLKKLNTTTRIIDRGNFVCEEERKFIDAHYRVDRRGEYGSLGISYIIVLEIRADILKQSIQVGELLIQEKSIDKELAEIWEKSAQKSIDFIEELLEKRAEKISNSYLKTSIWATKDSINWDYGDVVILRGNADSIIGYRLNNTDRTVCKDEVSLLEPFQNKGEPFCLELSQEDTMILGPERLLRKYINNPEYCLANIIIIEELEEDQIEFFKVPARLIPQKQEIRKVQQSIIITTYQESPVIVKKFEEKSLARNRSAVINKFHTLADTSIMPKLIEIKPNESEDANLKRSECLII